jgi:hypothetical protein
MSRFVSLLVQTFLVPAQRLVRFWDLPTLLSNVCSWQWPGVNLATNLLLRMREHAFNVPEVLA